MKMLRITLGLIFFFGAYQAFADSHQLKRDGDRWLCEDKPYKAARAYEEALAEDPAMTGAWFNLAIARYAQRDLPGSKKALQELLKHNPADAEARYNLGCMLLYEGKLVSAAKHFEKAGDCACPSTALAARIAKAVAFLQNLDDHVPADQRHVWLRMIQDGLEPA